MADQIDLKPDYVYDTDVASLYAPAGFALENGFNFLQPVGYYKFVDVQFYLRKKPRWLTRVMMRHFFELEWNDE